MIGERLLRSRNAAGLSMQALANQVGLSANMIKKYEHNQSMPSSANLLKLSKALGVRSEYFFRTSIPEIRNIEFRKRASTPVSLVNKIKSDVLDQAERWYELADIWPEFPIKKFVQPDWIPKVIQSLDEIDQVAILCRDKWQLGMGPLVDLIDLLESKGILVIVSSVAANNKLDGLQGRIDGQPVVVISENVPGDRQRFTLAHELGHLLISGRLSENIDEEKACNRFAANFILPCETLKNEIGSKRHNLEFAELDFLKQEYGISMQACLYRAKDCGIISDSYYTNVIRVFARNGWRLNEPGRPYPQAKTVLFKQLVFRALAEGIVGESKAAELLKMPLMAFHKARKLEQSNAPVDK